MISKLSLGYKGANEMISPATDENVHDWLRWGEENGSSFLKPTAEAALIANLKHYNLLRPALLELEEDVSGRTSRRHIASGSPQEWLGGVPRGLSQVP